MSLSTKGAKPGLTMAIMVNCGDDIKQAMEGRDIEVNETNLNKVYRWLANIVADNSFINDELRSMCENYDIEEIE